MEDKRVVRGVAWAMLAFLLGGCGGRVREEAGAVPEGVAVTTGGARPLLGAEGARRVVVELVRRRPELFIGRPDADRLAKLALVDQGEGTFTFGAFGVNPGAGWYRARVGDDAPEVYFYDGQIVWEGGKWMALEPRVTRAHRLP